MISTRVLTISALIAFAGLPAPLLAQEAGAAVDLSENAKERINHSGRLRMLSQRIPSAACHLDRRIEIDAARTLLAGAAADFDRILDALEFGGDEGLNILAPETRRRTLLRISELRALWEPLRVAAEALVDGGGSDADIELLLTQNLSVLQAAQLLVEELVKQYANPNATTQASLFLIDISGRQRMLTQKASKEACMLDSRFATESTASDLAGTVGIFEASLAALRFGMPEVGILPPPNDAISEGLDGVLNDWNAVKPYLDELAEGGAIDDDARAVKFTQLNTTMANMNTVVDLYTASAR